MDRNHFRADTSGLLGKHLRKFRKNPTSGLRGDAIMRKKFTDERTDGCTADFFVCLCWGFTAQSTTSRSVNSGTVPGQA